MDEGTNKISVTDSDELRTTSTSADDYDENTGQIRAEIEDTRAEMSQTINEIQERLSPEHLMGQVKETVREATIGKVEKVMERVGETISGVTEPALEVAGRAGTAIKDAGSSVADSVWRNPIPMALIGLGVGMLVMRNFGGQSYSTSSRGLSQGRRSNYGTGDVGQMRQTQGSGTLDHMKETAGDLANRSTQALSDLGTKARDGASVVTSRFGQMLHDNPLAVGAVAVAAGTAVGLMIPSTRLESEYIGETGERLVDSVQDAARGALDKVQDAARGALDNVQDAARQMASEGQQQPRP
ncbi:MAG TPA: DUF3618 domain-containing protein [Pyrinomonadaceae bacterium]|nr:DUF3618 domain-containing protein [Pyrinomonadaceae bacterium]